MTREKFIETLEKNRYSYEIVGDKIVVTKGNPSGSVYLEFLTSIPPGVEFKNRRDVDLALLKSLPPGVEFKNGRDVGLYSLKTLPPGVKFENGGGVYLGSLMGSGWFGSWEGNIKGIKSNGLLNKMARDGLFDKR